KAPPDPNCPSGVHRVLEQVPEVTVCWPAPWTQSHSTVVPTVIVVVIVPLIESWNAGFPFAPTRTMWFGLGVGGRVGPWAGVMDGVSVGVWVGVIVGVCETVKVGVGVGVRKARSGAPTTKIGSVVKLSMTAA